MAGRSRTADQIIAAIASGANGVVDRAELLTGGVTRNQIEHRLGAGALIPEYPGVYRVGHRAPSTEATYTAAVKACGRNAALAGPAAAHLLGLVKGAAPPPEVIAPTERRVEGIIIRRCRRLDPRHVSELRQVPVTTVPRTIVDLAHRMAADDLARLFHEAIVRYRTTPAQVEPLLRGRPGAARLRAVMYGDVPVSLSKVESRFFERIREARLPLPVTNQRVGNRYIDARWPGLTVEIDSYRYHGSRYAWEQDHRRQREARARGDDYLSYTWGDVFEDPGPMLRELRAALSPA
jgi:hypothetical protein